MKIDIVKRGEIIDGSRLDSPFFFFFVAIANRLIDSFAATNDFLVLSDKKLANIWQPNRNILAYAGEGEDYVSYIQPYDILEYLPSERSRISAHQNDIKALRVKPGTILQTCSGRNLGPLVIADKYLERFVLGSDLIRIDISDPQIRYYVFCFFSTWIGQAVLHSSKTGSVIDHLSIKDIEKIKVPMVDKESMRNIATLIKESYSAFETARITLSALISQYESIIGITRDEVKLSEGWNTSFGKLSSNLRIDAAFYDPATEKAKNELLNRGGLVLSEVADVLKPSGRNKTNYVDEGYGIPFISGRQLLQNQIVGKKHLPFSYSEAYKKFAIKEGYIAYPADGRVEGRLGSPVYITQNRDGWFASGHIGRIIAKNTTPPGYVFLAMMLPVVQDQIHALACGSVVDAVYPEDVENVVFPPIVDFPYEKVTEAWSKYDIAERKKQQACDMLEALLTQRESN